MKLNKQLGLAHNKQLGLAHNKQLGLAHNKQLGLAHNNAKQKSLASLAICEKGWGLGCWSPEHQESSEQAQ